MRNSLIGILTGTLLVTGTIAAHAFTLGQSVGISSSPNPVGSGARALGMGGAFIALADDATAASWNPAALIQLEKPEISIVGAFFNNSDDYTSSVHPEIDHSATNDDVNLNYFSATYPFNVLSRNMVISLNYQRLYEFNRSLDYNLELTASPSMPGIASSEQRSYNQEGYVGALGLAYSVAVTQQFSLGITLNLWTDELFWKNGWDERYANHSLTSFGSLTTVENTLITDQYSGFRGINANLGFLWNINKYLTIGGVVKTPFTADVNHTYSENWTQRDINDGSIYSGHICDTETVELDMPLSYGIGIAARFTDAFSMGLDIYQTQWEEYILTDGQGNQFSPIDSRPKNISDISNTTQVRLGAEYLFINPDKNWVIPLRGGFFYDPEPAQETVRDFYGLSIGSGISFEKFSVDVAYQFRWGPEVGTSNLITTSEADVYQHQLLLSLIYYF
ncbi:MAG TPA: hypothetical protein DDY20_05525 [Desulfobulbaceae bacterium]|nr:hypothetical protein [Desulfobulbaceae bacterium]